MKKRMPVAKIMTANPVSVNLSNDLNDVVEIFEQKKIRHLPVVSGEQLIGMISKTDIDRISYFYRFGEDDASRVFNNTLKLDQIMSKQLDTIQADDQVKEAAALLAKGEYHALPVMEGQKLTGIVTSTDVINYLLEQY